MTLKENFKRTKKNLSHSLLKVFRSISSEKRRIKADLSEKEIGHLNFILTRENLILSSDGKSILGKWIGGYFSLEDDELLMKSDINWINMRVSREFTTRVRTYISRNQIKLKNDIVNDYSNWTGNFSIKTEKILCLD